MANEFQGLFTSPEDIRLGRIQALEQQAAQQRTMGGSMSGLLGQVAAGTGGAIAEGLAGMFGLKTAQEKQAEQTQQLLGSIDTTDTQSLASGIEAAKAANLPKVVTYLQGKATELAASTRARQVEDREYALKWAAEQRLQGVAVADIRKTLAEAENLEQTLPLEIRLKQAQAIQEEVAADVAVRTNEEAVQLVQTELKQSIANLGLTDANTQQVLQSIAYAEELQPGKVKELKVGNAATEVATKLNELQIKRGRSLMPYEIAAANFGNQLTEEQILKVKADTAKALSDMNKPENTDFLVELDRAFRSGAIDDNKRRQLLAERANALGKTGGVAGIDITDMATKSYVDRLIKASDGLAAKADAERMATQMFEYSKAVTSGVGSEPIAALNSIAVKLGYGDKAEEVANEMFALFYGDLVLDKAQYMKGALSNADVQFLKDTILKRGKSAVALQTAFIDLAANKYAEASYARASDYIVGKASAAGDTKAAAPLGSSGVQDAIRTFARYQFLINNSKGSDYQGAPIQNLMTLQDYTQRQKAMNILGSSGLLVQQGKEYKFAWE
jgi:hypothetical protein